MHGINDIDAIVRSIVEAVLPEKIILFGSVPRGATGPASDVDLLVVKSGVHRRKLAMGLYERMAKNGWRVDLVVVTPEDIERYKDCPALVIGSALREGKVVYAA